MRNPKKIRFVPMVFSHALAMAFVLTGDFVSAREGGPDADEIVARARMSAAMQEGDLQGHLSDGRRRTPFVLSMADGVMQFRFSSPDQVVSLAIGEGEPRFKEVLEGKEREIAGERFGESVRDTVITYEDLALRFLFWPQAELLDEEQLKGRPAWKLRLNNPRREGPYAVVLAWIDQETSALMRVQGYDWQGALVKQFEVVSVMPVGDTWMLKEMRVERLEGGRVRGRTWLRLDEPVREGRGRRPNL